MKALDKRQKWILAALATLVAAALLFLLLSLYRRGANEGDEPSAVAVIPEADLEEAEPTKTGSYRSAGSPSSHWDSLEEEYRVAEDADETVPLPAQSVSSGRSRPKKAGVDDLFGDCHDSPAGQGSGPSPEGKGRAPDPPSGEGAPASDPRESAPAPPVKRSGAVSSLDEDVASPLGNGFSTLDGADRWVAADAGKPYRCMFSRDEKVRSGQRVTVRLLEDLVTDGVHIPRNTHLQGVATVSERLELAVSSLDVGGRIVSLRLEAYDTDGGRGIYCSDLGQARKEAGDQGLATASSLLNSRLGRVARDAAALGASMVRNKAGEATVSVPAGYTFYLVEKTD